MALGINAYSDNFQAFVDFATKNVNAGKGKAIARTPVEVTTGPLTGRNISASTTDKVYKFFRSPSDKAANDAARSLFRNAIIDMFGGESKIPQTVKTAMRLADYDKGKPLTARRIMAVKTAIDDIVKAETKVNTTIRSNIAIAEFDKLPEDIQNAIDSIKDEVNARCGEGTVKHRKGLLAFLRGGPLSNALADFCRGLARQLTGDDIRTVMQGLLARNKVCEKAMLLGHLKTIARNIEGAEPNTALAVDIMAAVPGLAEELGAAGNPAAFKAVLDKFGTQIEERLRFSAQINICAKKAPEMLVDEYAKATGLDRETLSARLSLKTFANNEVVKLVGKINAGEVALDGENGVEKAFQNLIKDFMSKRQALAAEVDNMQHLPAYAREHLRLAALTAPNLKDFNLNSAACAKQLDLKPLKSAVAGKPFKIGDAVKAMRAVYGNIIAIGKASVGEREWAKLGVDGQQPFASVLFKCAVAGDAELLRALAEHADELQTAIADSCSKSEGHILSINAAVVPAIKELFADFLKSTIPEPPPAPAQA